MTMVSMSHSYETVTQTGLKNMCEGLLSLAAHQHVVIPKLTSNPKGVPYSTLAA